MGNYRPIPGTSISVFDHPQEQFSSGLYLAVGDGGKRLFTGEGIVEAAFDLRDHGVVPPRSGNRYSLSLYANADVIEAARLEEAGAHKARNDGGRRAVAAALERVRRKRGE